MSCGGTLDRIIAKLKANGWQYPAQKLNALHADLESQDVSNMSPWMSELERNVGDLQDYLDILAQGRAALLFACNGFSVTMNPMDRGPDLKLEEDGKVIYVEVKRLRPGSAELAAEARAHARNGAVVLDVGRQVARMHEAISEKNRQGSTLPASSYYVVCIRSDSVVGLQELKWAVDEIERTNDQTASVLKNVGGVLVDIGGIQWPEMVSFHFWPNPKVQGTLRVDEKLANRFMNLKRPEDEEGRQILAELEAHFANQSGNDKSARLQCNMSS